MDYSYDEQEQDVAELAATIIAGAAAKSPDPSEPFDRPLWGELAKAGLIGIGLPEEHGGSGAGFVEQCILIEEAAKAAAVLFLPEVLAGAALPVALCGTEEQKRRFLPAFAGGELILSAAPRAVAGPQAVTAASPGFHVSAGEGAWRVNGAVAHVPLATVADRVLVEASDDAGRTGLLLIDPNGSGAALASHTSVDRAHRWRLSLDGYTVPADDVLVAPGELTEETRRRLDASLTVARCLAQLGTIENALAMTAAYVNERKQFGRSIGTFQAVSHKVADAYIDVQAVRLTSWRAAWLLAENIVDPEAVAIAAWWAADAPTRVMEAAMQVHGGIGVDLDFPLHRFFLAARQGSLALGGPSGTLASLGDLLAA
ncbi:acyl-CoA dehydrogenase family protein [Actinocorallia aurea]